MKMNPTDDSCTERSPCHECPKHLQGLEKNECVEHCARLKAYRAGEPWQCFEPVEIKNPGPKKKRAYHKKPKPPAPETCAIEGCNKEVSCRKLCKPHGLLWRKGKIEHPVLGKYFHINHSPTVKPTRKIKETPQELPELQPEQKPNNLDSHSVSQPEPQQNNIITLDLSNYPEIRGVVFNTANKFYLTPEHVVLSLIGERLAALQSEGVVE